RLRTRGFVALCGGGQIRQNEHMRALYDYDATMAGMRRIVAALFHSPGYPADEHYVRRRYESSIALARGNRWRRPGSAVPAPIRRHRRRASALTRASPYRC